MFSVPDAAEPLVAATREAGVFSRPTFARFIALMTGMIVSMGRRTVSHALVAIGRIRQGHWSNYHRLYSSARYSLWSLAAVLVRQVVALLPADAVIELVADDTVDGKQGDHVWAASAHRDPTRSTRDHAAIRYGHKWLALCVLVRLEGWDRPWALPILCGLCLPPKTAARIGRRAKTASQLARQMVARLMRWLPDRKFILTGDYQVVTHQTVVFAQHHADRLTVVGRLRGDANLYAPPKNPKARSRTGALRKKGRKLPSPQKRMAQLPVVTRKIAWYGASRRQARYVTEETLWYDNHGNSVMPIRWVGVLGDKKLGLEDVFFFCSDVSMDAARVIEQYARRWNIEVTFEEVRALLGLETTRHWCRQSVLRVTPMLLGLFSAVALIWHNLPKARRQVVATATPCYTKTSVTFADALAAVRRELWEETLLGHCRKSGCLTSLPRNLRNTLLWHLSAAA
jgi:DDE superfamily endonuclease